MIVLDCSAALEMVRGTEVGQALRWLCLRDEKVVSSSLLYPELCNALRKYVSARYLDRTNAAGLVDDALGLVDEFYGFEDLYQEVFNESCHLGHPSYDIFYFVLARRLGATLFTEDRRLVKLCEDNGVDCVHIVDLVKKS